MIGWVIAGAVVLILAMLLLMPLRIRISYQDGEVSAKFSVGPAKKTLYPAEEKPETPPEEKSPDAGGKPEKEKKPKRKRSINRQQILYLLENGPSILGRAVKRLGRRIRIRPLKLYLLVATDDPADTALLYGRIQAGLGACLPELHRHIHIDDQDIQVFMDFSEEKMDVIADVGASLRIWDAAVIGVCAGCSLIKLFFGFRRRRDREDPQDKKKQSDPVQRKPDEEQHVSDMSAKSNDEEKKNGC